MNKRQYKKQYGYNPPKLPSYKVFKIEAEKVEIMTDFSTNVVNAAFTTVGKVIVEVLLPCDSFEKENHRISKDGRYVR